MKKFAKVHHAALLSVSIVLVCMSFLWLDNAPAQTKVREGQVLFSATGHDHSGGANGNADLALDSLTVAGSVVATGTVYATGTITTAGDVTAGGDVSAGDDVIAGDDVRLSQGGMVILNSATDTATVSYNGTSIALSLGTTVAGNIESTSGDLIAFDDLIAGGDVVATGTITAASIEVSGNATAAYFIGDGSMLTGIAGGDFYKDGSVAMTGAYTSGIYGTNGYDFNQAGYLNSANYGRMFWDASKMAFRAGKNTGTEWQDSDVGYFSMALGSTVKASAQDSIAIGEMIIAAGQNSHAYGRATTASAADSYAFGKWLTSSAASAFVFGRGVDASTNRLVNNDDNSIMFGMNSTVPAIYIGSGSGVGTDQQVGFGTTAPLAGSLVDIDGVLNSASITSEGTIAATGTISSVAGYIANGNTGIDYTKDTCCTYDGSMVCTATGTLTFTKGILTAETCP